MANFGVGVGILPNPNNPSQVATTSAPGSAGAGQQIEEIKVRGINAPRRPGGPTPSGVIPEGGGNPEKVNAQIALDQYNDYVRTYVPFENEYIRQYTDPTYIQGKVRDFGVDAGQQFDAAAGTTARDLSRYGYTLSEDQQASLNKIRSVGRSLAVGNAQNQGRLELKDQRQQGLSFLADLFQNQAREATGQAGNLARSQAQRDSNNAQIGAANTAQNLQTAGTVASLAALAIIFA